MKKYVFLKKVMGFVVGTSIMVAPLTISAAVPSAADECAKELLLSYFPEPIVLDTLKHFSVPQDKWAGITKSLSAKDKEIVKIVEEKAKAMNPNPLKDPQQRQAAIKLFRDTLLEVFSDALKENGITDSSKFQAMLDDIQQQKAKKFAMCMEKKKNEANAEDSTKSEDDEDDNDDGDDEDDDEDDEEDDKDKKDSKSDAASTQDNTLQKSAK